MSKKQAEKALARTLYLFADLNQKEIGEKVKTSEKTIGKWITEEGWEALKTAHKPTRDSIIAKKYLLLESIVDLNREKLAEGTLTPGDIDSEHKLSMSIKALTNEETLAGYIQSFTPFLNYCHANHPAFAKQFAEISQGFLLEKAGKIKED